MILLDTSILSLAYRRKYQDHTHKPVAVKTLEQMIIDNEPLALPAAVVQEFLTGLREETQFQKLQKVVAGFPVLKIFKFGGLNQNFQNLRIDRIKPHPPF